MAFGFMTCDSCDGCGQVTDNDHRIPWTWHTRELRDQNDMPLFPEAKPTQCNKCNGSGRIPRSQYNPFHWKKGKR